MKKSIRHEKIKNIISEQEISTQEELSIALNNIGCETTQATVSRDIKELGLTKINGKIKKYKYAFETPKTIVNNKIANIFKASVLSIESSLNLIVVKTSEGSANGAGFFLDKLHLTDILGTISGDDTVLVIAKSVEAVPAIIEQLKEFLK